MTSGERPVDAGWYVDPHALHQLRWWDGQQWTHWRQQRPDIMVSEWFPNRAPEQILNQQTDWGAGWIPSFGPRTHLRISGLAALVAAVGLAESAAIALVAAITGKPVPGVGIWLLPPAAVLLIVLQLQTNGVLKRRARAAPGPVQHLLLRLRHVFGDLPLWATIALGGLAGLAYLSWIVTMSDHDMSFEQNVAGVAVVWCTNHLVVNAAEWLRSRAALRARA